MRPSLRIHPALILGLLLSFATSGGVATPAHAVPREASHSLSESSPAFLPGGSFESDLRVAVFAVDSYWRAHWADFFTGRYTPPRLNPEETLGLYDGRSASVPTCRGKRMAPNNAGYCKPEDFLAWDVTFMLNGYATGDGFVYTTVAHEWAHAIQNRIRGVAVEKELQADCLAGAELYGAAREGGLQFQPGDEAEIARTLTDTADPMPGGNHGTASQRIEAFRLGALHSVPACLPYGA